MKLVLVLFLLLAGIPLLAQQDRTITLTSDGVTRSVLIHLPSSTPAAGLPVLLCYHGSGGTSASMKSLTGFNALSDGNDFIVAYPQGMTLKGTTQWNCLVDGKPGHAGIGADDAPNDVTFTRDMIRMMADSFAIDTARVFAAGFSNGAYMCYALSMLASEVIHGIAPVAGDMWTDDAYLDTILTTGSARPMPVMHVHGTADATVKYPDANNTPEEWGEYPLFVAARGCGAHTYSQTIPLADGVDKLVFCPPPVEVCLIRITGMGHSWGNSAFKTSREIVSFFGLGKTSGIGEVREETHRSFITSPAPAASAIELRLPSRGRVELYSMVGSRVYAAEHEEGAMTIPCSELPRGVYLARFTGGDGHAITERVIVSH